MKERATVPPDMLDQIIHGDCLEIMRRLPDGCVDAVITDPPYCSGAITEAARTRSNRQGVRSDSIGRFRWFVGDNMGTAGLAYLLREIAVDAKRITKPTGSLLVFCDWRMTASLQPAIESAGWRFQNLIVWNKGQLGMGRGFRCQHELVLHFAGASPEYHHRGTANVLTHSRIPTRDRLHPTQKPEGLLEDLIRVVTPNGGLVLDALCGSGTTCVAAKRLGRHWIGIDIDETYCRKARARLRDTEAPLFAEAT